MVFFICIITHTYTIIYYCKYQLQYNYVIDRITGVIGIEVS